VAESRSPRSTRRRSRWSARPSRNEPVPPDTASSKTRSSFAPTVTPAMMVAPGPSRSPVRAPGVFQSAVSVMVASSQISDVGPHSHNLLGLAPDVPRTLFRRSGAGKPRPVMATSATPLWPAIAPRGFACGGDCIGQLAIATFATTGHEAAARRLHLEGRISTAILQQSV